MAQQTAAVTLTITIHGALTIMTQSLPPGTVGQPYNQQIQVAGGTPPYTFSATGLPAGLSISATGIIAGTPTAAGAASVVVSVSDSGT